MGFILNIQTEASVNAWKQRAQELNNQAKQAVDEAMELLKEMPNVATGTFFNQVLEIGNNICSGMIQVMQGMQQLFEAVSKIVEIAKQAISGLVDGVAAVGKLIGAG